MLKPAASEMEPPAFFLRTLTVFGMADDSFPEAYGRR